MLQFRVAEPSDNDAILALAERCPQEGIISFTVHRKPRYDTLLKLIDPDSWHYVASDGDEVVGLIGVIHFNVTLHGKPAKCAYMMDFRVDPRFRSTTVTYRMVKGAVDRILKSDADFVIGNFLKANAKPTVFASGRAGFPPGHHLGDNRVFYIIPWRKLHTDPKYTFRRASESDIPELADLYAFYSKSFRMAPVLDEKRIRSITSTIQGLSMDQFLVACEGDVIRAVTAVWDEHHYRHYQVQRVNTQIKWANRLVRTLNFVRPMPKPIELNAPLRQRALMMYANDGDHKALVALIRHVNNLQLGSDSTLISLYTRDNDPITSHLNGLTGITVQSEMYLYANDNSIYNSLNEPGAIDWLDMALMV
jgi:hypothetical protein